MPDKYPINLTLAERNQLIEITKKGKTSARKLKRAQTLLLADSGYKDAEIAQILQQGIATVGRIRKKFVEEGIEFALQERPRPGRERKLDGKGEAFLVATACSHPPEGRNSWTMQLLADKLVQLQLVESIDHETVRQILKKRVSQ